MLHHIYILQSLKDGKYYIGYTTDVEERLKFHNAGLQRSKHFNIHRFLVRHILSCLKRTN
ncbi:MAG: GIY-YIG nuclease family protein [Terrimonas ferruginea]|uniref:GIY-YIG nuclease family protein n=1 Tax=Terrimonas ferruginea TaxID=249 RepID=UPI001ACC76B4|nr:GIY-YIG nuclease family protein [Terrimonas ferruginea]